MNDIERTALQQKIIGPVVPINVPYKEDESIDYDALGKYVNYLAQSNIPTLLLTFGSSEYSNLSDKEIYEITRIIGSVNNGRSVFVGATKAWSIKNSLEYIEFAKKWGAHSIMIQPPLFGGDMVIDQDRLVDYYKLINDETELPIWGYSIPVAGKHKGIASSTWKRIVEECSNVYAMKTDGDMIYGLYDFVQASGGKAMIVSGGQMKTMLFGWPLGSKTFLCSVAPVFPEVSIQFAEFMKKGMVDAAIEIIHTFEDKIIGMCNIVDWLTLIKAMLYCAGFFSTPILRCPAHTANNEQIVQVGKLYNELKETANKI